MKVGFRTIKQLKKDEIHMRDPFVYCDKVRRKYFLFGTTLADGCGDKDPIFEVYVSDNLDTWEGPYVAFDPPKGFWGVRHYWAPEVYEYEGSYYMLATFKGGIGTKRGTGVLKSDNPEGPYTPHINKAITPESEEALDATLYVDEDGQPWIIYCHEWTEIYEGKIKACKVSKDLKEIISEPIEILKSSDMKWIRKFGDSRIEKDGYLTDAPFMYKCKNGRLILLWSSYSYEGYTPGKAGGYTVARAYSENGRIDGEWIHEDELLLDSNEGHCSLFRDLEDNLMLCLHSPDTPHGQERPKFIKLNELENNLEVNT